MAKKLFPLILLALAVRISICFFQYSGDVKNHIVWADSVISQGTYGLYLRHFAGFNDVNYPPVSIMFFSVSRVFYQAVGSFIHWQNFHAKFLPSVSVPFIESENAAAGFMKFPSILADVFIGLLIFLIAKKNHQSNPLPLASLYWFNPAVIYVSSVWGQIESIPLLFLISSFYLLSRKKSHDYWLSHFCFVLAVLSKQTALWLLPVYLVIWWRQGSVQKLFKGLLLQFLAFFIIYSPFTPPPNAISSFVVTLAGSSTLISDQAYNLWYLLYAGQRLNDSIRLLGLSVRLWSVIFLVFSYLFIVYKLIKKFSISLAANSLFWLSLAAFFLQTRIHERHLAPALLFVLLTNFQPKTKITLFLFLSVYHLANLYTGLRLPFI